MTLELLGTAVGIIYLWLEYRASIYLWIAGIIMPAIYIFIYYEAGLYADFGINIYYLLIALYGWIAWKTGFTLWGKNKKSKEAYRSAVCLFFNSINYRRLLSRISRSVFPLLLFCRFLVALKQNQRLTFVYNANCQSSSAMV